MSRPLTPVERERLEQLFDVAAELPHQQRANFIEHECADNEALREALERLLAGLDGEDHLSRIQPGAPTRAGTHIGAYELQERVGVGGMGEVYAAEQREPIARRVALKIIKPGMDSEQVVARFEAERQALARMTHPNIAQVYDGGTTDDGRPYFVMEYVAGEPITEYCDRRKLSTNARLELFLSICDGVQHAHQKGIIHRDLKPSNLLVSNEDGDAHPKIIDFGVARATTGQLAERTLHTLLGQIVGTLDYMSPEQADPTGLDIDTRSDIYSLGVVLYQLLTGLLPFEHHGDVNLSFSEIQRAIRETEPPTPSTRLRREKRSAIALAPLRGTNDRAWIRQLSGDLDWICMKALEKEPARRYASAIELAADVRRHLTHLPVLAARPDAVYRARKFLRRHRVGVAGSALIVAGLTVGGGGVVSGRMDALASDQRLEALQPQADASHARRLLLEANELWPPYPDRVSELDSWCAEARALTFKLDKYRADLRELRLRATPWTDEERERDRKSAPFAEDLELVEPALDFWKSVIAKTPERPHRHAHKQIDRLEAFLASSLPEAEARRTWSFESEVDRSSHEVLQGLVVDLGLLGDERSGLLAADAVAVEHAWSVTRRLNFARKLAVGFAAGGEYAELWLDALPKIRAAYPGLELELQMGLVPISPDPHSGLWEFAHLQSGAPALRGADGRLILTPDTGLVLVLLRGGSFWMGSQSKNPDGHNHYDPGANARLSIAAHGADEVTLSDDQIVDVIKALLASSYNAKGERETNRGGSSFPVDLPAFFLSKYEMTQAQWEFTTGENPSLQQGQLVQQSPLNPINNVTWLECRETLGRLGLALSDEEQWEYAARAGSESPWWTGHDESSLQGAANVFDLSAPEASWNLMRRIFSAEFDDGAITIDEVWRRRANAFGLHDVSGNVSEWCANHPYTYGAPPSLQPGTRTLRAVRGGNARLPALLARSAARVVTVEGVKSPTLGLRPARLID